MEKNTEKKNTRKNDLKPLDELFQQASDYKKSRNFKELFEFMAKFPKIAPYNVMLMHVQKPHCQFVATAREWAVFFGRSIKPEARPIVILKSFRPVEFLFDLSDTDGDVSKLPDDVMVRLNKVKGRIEPFIFRDLVSNLPADGVRYQEIPMASTTGGNIRLNNYYQTQVV